MTEKTKVGRMYLAVGCGAAIGSLLRFLAGVVIVDGLGQSVLWTTTFVNVVGSFIIMLFATSTGPEGRWPVGAMGRLFVMGGVCGGFTTFSAMSLDSYLLMLDASIVTGALYLGAVVSLSLAAAWCGHMLAVRINR